MNTFFVPRKFRDRAGNKKLFIIHKVKSLLIENRREFCSNNHFIDLYLPLVEHISPVMRRKSSKTRKCFFNKLVYNYNIRQKKIDIKESDGEDVILTFSPKLIVEVKRHRISKSARTKQFREKVKSFLGI